MFRHAFYNGRSKGAKFIHKGILRVSDPHTHVETVFSDGMSWSSEFGIGPRFKKITYAHPERWKFVEFPFITPEQERIARYRAELWVAMREAGLSNYDTLGAIGCGFSGRENPWNLFCSEGCYDIFPDEHKLLALNVKMHPQRLLQVDGLIIGLKNA